MLKKTSFAVSSLPQPQQSSSQSALIQNISEEELRAFERYKERSESVFAFIFEPNTNVTLEKIKASTCFDSLSRTADILLIRASHQGGLIVFASDLEDSILSTLLEYPVTLLSKQADCLNILSEPWCSIRFAKALSEGTLLENTELNSNKIQHPPEDPKTSMSPVQGDNSDLLAMTRTAERTVEGETFSQTVPEDFDTNNLAKASKQKTSELDNELLQDFLLNADDLIEKLSQSLLELESDPNNKEAIESIFRNAHTIKGTAGMFGFNAIEKLTHIMENLFDKIRKGNITVSAPLIDGLFFGVDRIKTIFQSIKQNQVSEHPINDAIAKITLGSQAEIKKTTKSNEIPALPKKNLLNNASSAVSAGGGGDTLRVDLKRLDSLVNLVGELVIDRTRFARIEDELRMRNANSELSHDMSESVLLFGRHMNEVQSIIMKIRMVPIGNAFYKFTRVVRDLARQCEKEIDLSIEGGETELDKTLVE
ncbi:MAG: Hpt domain-containing protein, partial [Silvanigrellaceae bacterium]|nr:Hpt domain-containing protein [Silvanigrellaceae bacterium]